MAFNAGPAIEKLKSFDVRSIVYYKIQDHEVSVDVLIPKDLKPEGKRPVIVRFHGGFLVSPTYSDKASKQRANQGKRIFGSSLFLGTFQPWIMDLALQYSAVIVSPNYVKLPESNGVDILHNLRSFWGWFRINFESFVTGETNGKVSVDIICDSGACGNIKAIITAYPMLDLQDTFFTDYYVKAPFHMPMLPHTVYQDHVTAIKPGKVISATNLPARLDLAIAAVQHGKYSEMMGEEDVLYPMRMLEQEGAKISGKFPPLFIYHGDGDLAVPAEGTRKFVQTLQQSCRAASGKVFMKLEIGDHGFDTAANLNTQWLKEGLVFMVDNGWPEQSSHSKGTVPLTNRN